MAAPTDYGDHFRGLLAADAQRSAEEEALSEAAFKNYAEMLLESVIADQESGTAAGRPAGSSSDGNLVTGRVEDPMHGIEGHSLCGTNPAGRIRNAELFD